MIDERRHKRRIAVAYYRMSTDRQDKSIPEQRAEVEKLAEKGRYQIIREYVDKGISGDATKKRQAFQRMIADAKDQDDFEAILAWDQDRFGRFNSLEAGYWIYPLVCEGVRLVTVAQGEIDWNDFSGRIVYAVQQEAKFQFLVDLARNSVRGLLARAQQGLWVGGRPPFGYDVGADGRLVPGDSSKVAAVRRIFRMRLEGMGYRTIAGRLNADGVVSPSGGAWSHDAVRLILQRETYCGVVTLGAHNPGKYYTASNGEVTKARRGAAKNPTRIADAHEALIDRETFDAVQAMRLKPPKPHWRNGREGAPLAGLLYCGRCGNVMYAQSLQRKSGQKFPNYVCATYHKGRGCGYCVVPQEVILMVVANTIREAVLKGSPERLERAVADELARREKAADSIDCRQRAEKELSRLDNQIKRATRRLLVVDDLLVSDLERELLLMKGQHARMAAELPKPREKPDLSPKEIAAGVWKLDEILRTASPSKVRKTLSTMIDRITLQFEPGRKNKRGQSFRLVEGRIEFCTTQWGHPGSGR